jgi:hypothetical protein
MNATATKFRQYSNFLSEELGFKGDAGYIAGITDIQDRQVATRRFGVIPAKEGRGLMRSVIHAGQRSGTQTEIEALHPFITKTWEAFGLPPQPAQYLR